MTIILNYLCRTGSTIYKHITRGYVSSSGNRYKNLPNRKGVCRETVEASNIENSLEFCNISNGMRLACQYKNSCTVTLGCFIPTGSMYETPQERGSSLFLEHLLFRRTKHKNQEQLERTVEEIGARVAAVAMRDMFLFYGIVPSSKIDKLIALFADVILNGITCDADVSIEKYIILHELSKMELNRERVVMDYLSTIAYQDTPLANSIYPEADTIKKFYAQNLIEFRNRLFKTCFMTMVCIGPIHLQQLQQTVCKYFHEIEDEESSTELPYSVQSCTESLEYRFSGAELRVRDDDDELGYAALAIEGPSHKQYDDYIALNVAKQIVGSWNRTCSGANHNAPFIAHCAYNTDLCHMYKSFFYNWVHTTSIWGCYFVSDKMSLHDMLDLIQAEWMRLCTTITTKEIIRAINQCKTEELIRLNDPIHHLYDIVRNLYRYGHYKPVNQRLAVYEKVTVDKIREVSDRYIYDQSPAVVAVGRIENFPEYCMLREGMYLLRY